MEGGRKVGREGGRADDTWKRTRKVYIDERREAAKQHKRRRRGMREGGREGGRESLAVSRRRRN